MLIGAVGTLVLIGLAGCPSAPTPLEPYRVTAIGRSNSTRGERLTLTGPVMQDYIAYPAFPILLVQPGMMIAAKHNFAAVPISHPVIEVIPCKKHPDCIEHHKLITKGATNPLPDPVVTIKQYRALLVPVTSVKH